MVRLCQIVISLFCCFLVLFLQSCASTVSRVGVSVNSPSSGVGAGIGVGFLIDQEISKNSNVLNNQIVQNYVNTLGQTLALNSGRPDIQYKFTVINDPDINAFTVPGGYIYITTGMLNFLHNEAELAAVFSHEIAHVVARHQLKSSLVGMGLDITLDYLGQLTNIDPNTVIPQLAQTAIYQKFSRSEETQADEIGARIMALAGYSPYGMVQLFQGLNTLENRRFLSNFLASHPSSQARVRDIEGYIVKNNLYKPGLIIDRPIFHQVIALF